MASNAQLWLYNNCYDVISRTVDLELYEISAAIPNLSDGGSTLVVNPGRGTSQGMQEAR
jgi:hypothetical protein